MAELNNNVENTYKKIVLFLSRIDSLDEKMEKCSEACGFGELVISIMEKRNEQVNFCLRTIRKNYGIEIPYVSSHKWNVVETVSEIEAVKESIETILLQRRELVAM